MKLILAAAAASLVCAGSALAAPPPCKAAPAKITPKVITGGADAVANLAKARAFLAGNAKQAGVVSLPSGAQYKIVSSGDADNGCATLEDRIRISYEGKLEDGTVFDASPEGGTATYALTDLVPGWQAVVPLMRRGDEWMIYLPPQLGYGAKGGDKIPPNSALIFRLKLVGIM